MRDYDSLGNGLASTSERHCVGRTPSMEHAVKTVSGVATFDVDDMSSVCIHRLLAPPFPDEKVTRSVSEASAVQGSSLADVSGYHSNDFTRTQTRVNLNVLMSRTGGNLCGLNLELLAGRF